MALVVGRGVDVHLDELQSGFVQLTGDPVGGDEGFGTGVAALGDFRRDVDGNGHGNLQLMVGAFAARTISEQRSRAHRR